MATLQTIAYSSPCISHTSQKPSCFLSGITSGVVSHSSRSAFNGQALTLPISQPTRRLNTSRTFSLTIQMVKPSIQFIPGRDEQTIPDVKLTKSRDGTNGQAIFKFNEPSVFDSSGEVGDITGFFMIDEEGTLQSVDVSAKFVNGRPAGIEAKYVMRTPRDWDRFMRFMERYANVNGLQFIKS
ncbi:photosystem II reaction center PSB28 protein, chloroplastic-like [Rutidosis leptorrhynchoides]|uniref:photosystem II reaction center PSB28 protein, chloroplastic-like n=1 Tax=Rutidosis leptorrhynchoides TaxID=125765 RepID=UPI003A99C276